MAFVLVSGWQVPVKVDSGSRELLAQGELSPSWSNRPLRRRQALAKKYAFTTSELSAEDATTLEGLLEGRGHYWDFRYSLHSSAGLGPEAGYSSVSVSFAAASSGPAAGVCMRLTSGSMIFDTQLPDDWTISYMASTSATSGWLHRVIRSDGAKWQNGVRDDALVHNELYVSSGAVVLTDSGSLADPYFAEMVVLPFKASDGFVKSLRPSGLTFSSLPRLTIAGEITGNRVIEVLGTNAGQSYTSGVKTGTWKNNTREVQAEFEEVVPRQEGPTMPFRAHTALLFDDGALSGTTRRPLVGDFTPLTNAGQTYTTTPFISGRRFVSMDGTQTGENSGQDMTNSLQDAGIISFLTAFVLTSRAPSEDTYVHLVDNSSALIRIILSSAGNTFFAGATATSSGIRTISIGHTIEIGYLYVAGFFADFSTNTMGIGWCRGINTGVYGVPLASDWTESSVSPFSATSFSAPTSRTVKFFSYWNGNINFSVRGTGIYSALIKNRRISESDLRQTYRAIVAGNFR